MMKQTLYAFTSAACNYLPKVRMLTESLRRHHPEFHLVLALSDLIDDPEKLAGEGWDEVMPVDSLDIPDWRRWAFTHDIVELSTAIKPFVLSRLLSRPDCGGVLYFDPDMALFSRLDDLLGELTSANVVLTPHQTAPETGLAEVMDNEICSLKHGIYNLGFIGVRPTAAGKAFADWWADRVYHFCRDDIPNGLFTDQRWIDLAPALFDGVHVLRSSRFNVAPWNMTTRFVSGDAIEGFRSNGEPLGFYHFTGFDSGAHRIMTEKYCSDNPAVAALVDWYERETSGWRQDSLSHQPWAFGRFEDGTKILRAHRVIYRSRYDLQRRFPNPFAADTNEPSFVGWCESQGLRDYPDLLPVPKEDADWSAVTSALMPSLAPPADALPSLSTRLGRAATSSREARILWGQVVRVLRREGLGGLIRRLRRASGRS